MLPFAVSKGRQARLSENLNKQVLKKVYQRQNYTEHELKKNSSIDHQNKMNHTNMSNTINQAFSLEQINRAYDFLCNNNSDGCINLISLAGFLEEQGEGMYTGVQMISLLDKERKGFVGRQQFFNFFEKNIQDLQPQVPQQMKKQQQWVKSIDKNFQGPLKNFKDPQYCEYAAKQIKRFKYSQQL